MKKAQGLPLNTIVIAIIALAVLFILIFIFTGKINVFGEGSQECPGACSSSASCDDVTADDPESKPVGYLYGGCPEEGSKYDPRKYCCPGTT